MATWKELSQESRHAAQMLLSEGIWRASVSRSYYAAYSALAGALAGKVPYGSGRDNPSHADLPAYILRNLAKFSLDERHELRRLVGRLWRARVEADYIPAAYLDRGIALASFRDANRVLFLLEVSHD